MQKHVYGRVVERKRPLQEYDQYSSRAKHTALDESKVKEHLRSLSHETGLRQGIMHTASYNIRLYACR